MKRVGLIVLVILVIDQIIKIWIKTSFDYGEKVDGGFIDLYFVENEGMAFGMSWGGATGKVILSLFRILAVGGIGYFIFRLSKKPNIHKGFLSAMALIFAGAFGNIIDSAFYGFLFDQGTVWNPDWEVWEPYSGQAVLNFEGYAGFLQGTVVDMFQFDMSWPSWMPWVGGKQVFNAIWNFADFSISIGVILIIIRQKTFFSKKKETIEPANQPAFGEERSSALKEEDIRPAVEE